VYSNYIIARANFDTTSGNLVHSSSGASVTANYIVLDSEGSAGTASLCADTGTTWTSNWGAIRDNSANAIECSGGATIGFSGVVGSTGYVASSAQIVIGATALPGQGGVSGASWSSGSSAPSGSCTNGSLYSNIAGSSGSTLYACVSGAWTNVK
jgi:hypothetical protein